MICTRFPPVAIFLLLTALSSGGPLIAQSARPNVVRAAAPQGLPDLLNVEFALTRLVSNGKEATLPRGASITLKFLDGSQFAGRSTVNSYSGKYTATPEGSFSMQQSFTTQMLGSGDLMAFESTYFNALSAVRHIQVKARQLVLSKGPTSMEFAVRAAK